MCVLGTYSEQRRSLPSTAPHRVSHHALALTQQATHTHIYRFTDSTEEDKNAPLARQTMATGGREGAEEEGREGERGHGTEDGSKRGMEGGREREVKV